MTMTRTNAYTLLCVAIRAVVVWVAASALVALPAMLYVVRDGDITGEGRGLGLTLAVSAVVFVLLLLAWLFADKLARLTMASPREPVFESTMEPSAWLGLAISVIGAWFLFVALKDAAYLLIRWVVVSRNMPGAFTLDNGLDQLLPDALALAIEAILALVFLLRGRGLANLIHRWRYGSLPADAAGPR